MGTSKKNVLLNAKEGMDDAPCGDEIIILTAPHKNYLFIKRLVDVFLSFGAIIVLSPLLIGISVAIKIDSPGPVLFKQKRIGKDKEIFEIFKFRSMCIDAPKDTPTHMFKNTDTFITKIGRVLRKTSLDELPQLFNILKGDMSIIGPRPALWNQDDLILERDKYGANNVLPGLTGWAQINGRDELEIPVKARFDGDYIKKIGLVMDARCFFGTISSVLCSDGIIEGGVNAITKSYTDTNVSNLAIRLKREIKTGVKVVGLVLVLGIIRDYLLNKKKNTIEKNPYVGAKILEILATRTVLEAITNKMCSRKRNECNRVDLKSNDNVDIVESIQGKKILFFSPAFFGYENLIKKKMEDMGAECDVYDVRSVTSARDRAVLKISSKIFAVKSENYYENIFLENKNKNYDYILIVKCDMTSINVLKKMRNKYPNAKLCLYLWDSVKNIPGIIDKFQYFDTLHSFDLDDCIKYPALKFRPLFYADEYQKALCVNQFYKYDISFLGTVHSDRYKVIKQVKRISESSSIPSFWFCYLQSKFIYGYYKMIKKEFATTVEDDFSYKKKSSDEIASIVDQTKIVLDIQHPKQTGLTMRTIEMLGMNKKLITTNARIKEYDFYNPKNISVIDRNKVKIDTEFLNSDYEPISVEVYKKYSLENWIKEVLS